MSKPLVSIILVVYNNQKYLKNCLDSVLKISYLNKEIIVLNNASSDRSQKILDSYAKKIICLQSEENLGYAAGNNLCFKTAKGAYLLVLNPDTEVTKDFLEPLVARMEASARVAASQPAIYLLDTKNKLNLSGKKTHYLGFDWIQDYGSTAVPPAGNLISISGCCVLLRKTAAAQVRYFDPSYFMYYEDSDLSWKLRLLGYKLMFEPASKIYHEYKLFPPEEYLAAKKKLALQEKNRLATIFKNYTTRSLWLLFPALLMVELAMVLYAVLTGWGVEKLKTYSELAQQFPHLQSERKQIQALRKISDQEIIQGFESQLGFIFAQNPVVRFLLNPVLRLYWKIISKAI